MEISDSVHFCPNCGAATSGGADTAERLQLICKNCGGVMELTRERDVTVCPYCGSREQLVEADSVRIERIRAEAYKNVEMAKIQHARERDAMLREDAERAAFKRGKLSKALLVFAVFCALLFLGNIDSGFLSFKKIATGGVLFTQVLCFTFAWIIGMGYIRIPGRGVRNCLAAVAFALFIPLLILMA